MKKRKFQDGGVVGRFDEDVYARARKFIEDQEKRAGEGLGMEEEPKPKAVARKSSEPAKAADVAKPASVPSVGSVPSTGRAEIPVDTSMKGPAKQFSSAMEMGDTGRMLSTTLGATGGAGAAAIRSAPMLPKAVSTAFESAKGMAAPAVRAAKEGLEVAKTSGPKAGLETARSTLRGMKSRAEMQAKRGARQTAEEMEKAKPVLQARRSTKPERAARTRRTEEDMGIEFSRGGSASSRADGCAKRGKTKGKLY